MVAGCNMDLTGIQQTIGGYLTGIGVHPDSATMHVGDTLRMSATGGVSGLIGMLGYDPLPDATWQSSNSAVARLEPVAPPPPDSYPAARVRLLAWRPGETQVTVSARGFSATARVIVISAIEPPE
jgi:hypothetical protein